MIFIFVFWYFRNINIPHFFTDIKAVIIRYKCLHFFYYLSTPNFITC